MVTHALWLNASEMKLIVMFNNNNNNNKSELLPVVEQTDPAYVYLEVNPSKLNNTAALRKTLMLVA